MAAANGAEAEPFGVGGTLHFETARAGRRKVPKIAYVLLVASVRSLPPPRRIPTPSHLPHAQVAHRCAPADAPACDNAPRVQILAVSSAASAFRELDAADPAPKPLTVAAWRLQATSLLLAPLFVFQWRRCTPETRAKCRQLWWLLAGSGACLAAHFGTWVWGLDHTSIPHGLLFVTTTPLIMTVAALVMRVPISRGEVLGAVGGFCGMVLLCLDTASRKEVRTTARPS